MNPFTALFATGELPEVSHRKPTKRPYQSVASKRARRRRVKAARKRTR